MKWNDVEMIDGEFYFVDVKRWRAHEPNEWVFVYKENSNYATNHYCTAKVSQDNCCSVYDSGHVCSESTIINLRKATPDDITRFYDYLDRYNYRYSLNTKRLRYVERG